MTPSDGHSRWDDLATVAHEHAYSTGDGRRRSIPRRPVERAHMELSAGAIRLPVGSVCPNTRPVSGQRAASAPHRPLLFGSAADDGADVDDAVIRRSVVDRG